MKTSYYPKEAKLYCYALSILCFFLSFNLLTAQNYITNGSASQISDSCFQLTPADDFLAGSVWFQNKVSLSSDFEVEAEIQLAAVDQDPLGADGIAFVLQPVCNGLGAVGGGLGYLGISPSLAIEFDTWQNPANVDPIEDHISLQQNGILVHGGADNLAGPFDMGNLEDGAFHSVLITWDATSQIFSLTFDGTLLFDYSGDIVADIFGGNSEVFWGFTAATGEENNDQQVCIGEVSFEEMIPYTVTNTTCPNSSDGAIDLEISGGVGPFTYLWSNGEPTQDLMDIAAGNYTVEVTDANGCVSTFMIDVDSEPDLIDPTITCPINLIIPTDAGVCGAVVDYIVPEGEDNCPDPVTVLSAGLEPGMQFPVGENIITYTVTDGADNSASCSFTITVNDLEAPEITCPADIQISCEDSAEPSNTGEATATDNCGLTDISFEDVITAGSCPNNFDISRTWLSTDSTGNSSNCIQIIAVRDTTAPIIICPADTTVVCTDITPAATGTASASDNCAGDIEISYEDAIVSGDCGWECTIERTWTATDSCGNSSSCVQTIISSVLPLIETATETDIDGDGVADPIQLGILHHTVTIELGGAACILEWMPGVDAPAWSLTRENVVIDGTDCTPGENPVAADGQIMNPLMAAVLQLDIKLRLDPDYGDITLEETGCDYHPILNQYMPNYPTIRDLYELSQIALGSLIGPPHLEHLLFALQCVNDSYSLCDPEGITPLTTPEEWLNSAFNAPVLESDEFTIFPNPASGRVSMNLTGFDDQLLTISVFDQTGKIVFQRFNVTEIPVLTVDLDNWPEGLYLVELRQKNNRMSKKFIKTK